MNFTGFLGNEEVKTALSAAFTSNRFPQALIIEGEEGLGKKTLARLLSRAFVCLSENKPCGVCSACVQANVGSHPDIKVEEGSGATSNISVEAVRKITADVYRKPEFCDHNVYLFFIKNRLLEASQNKLLKVIEEPPSNSVFVFCIDKADKLLTTIRSRATTISLSPVNKDEAARFVAEKNNIDMESALNLANIYGGNIGKMLEGESELASLAINIASCFDSRDEDNLLAITYPLIKSRDDFCTVLGMLSCIFRDAYMLNVGIENYMGISPEQSLRISKAFRKSVIVKLPDLCNEYISLARKNLNMNLLITDFCGRIRETILNR